MRPTIRDVAREAGVSVSTASRALNNRYDIRTTTRERVLSVAERLGYVPSFVARGLVSGKSRAIGVIITSIGSPVFSRVLQGIERVAKSAGYSVLLCSSEDCQEQAMECLSQLVSNHVEGVILTPVQTDQRDVSWLRERNLPFILQYRYFPELDVDYVAPHHEEGGYLVTRHLISLGHRHIGHLGGPLDVSSGSGRYAGYCRALDEAGISPLPHLVRHGPFTVAGGYAAALELLAGSGPPTAIFAATDLQAVGVMKAAREMAIRIPHDLALAGGDNIELAEFLEVPLTTFDSRAVLVGVRAAEVMIARLRGQCDNRQQIIITPELIVRASSGGTIRPASIPSSSR